MNRHEDDSGHSSQSSRHSTSRIYKSTDDITILIEALTGQQYELKCSPTENILSIKGRLARLEGISTSQQHIIYSGKLLNNASVLKDVGVTNFSKLRLVTQMRGGPVNTRIIDDEPEESEAEIALVVLKDGEKVSLVRFPFSGSLYADFENDQFRQFMSRHGHSSHANSSRPKSRELQRTRQDRTEDNKRTENKMEELRKKMKFKKKPLPPIKNQPSILPPINSKFGMVREQKPELKMPVPNTHSNFLQKYGLKQTKTSSLPDSIVQSILPSVKKASRPRCKKCGKRLGLTEQYKCRCGDEYCSRHRYAEEHDCSFDYRTEQKSKLQNQNRNIQPPKLPKI